MGPYHHPVPSDGVARLLRFSDRTTGLLGVPGAYLRDEQEDG